MVGEAEPPRQRANRLGFGARALAQPVVDRRHRDWRAIRRAPSAAPISSSAVESGPPETASSRPLARASGANNASIRVGEIASPAAAPLLQQ